MRTVLTLTTMMTVLTTCCANEISASAPDKAIPFDGSRIHAVPGDTLNLDPEHLTVATWVRLEQTDEAQVFLNRGPAGGMFTFYLFRDNIRMLIANAPDSYTHARCEPPEVDTWTHLAGTYDGQTIRIYRNGALAMETNAPGRMATGDNADLFVGSLNDYERPLHGAMADIRIWRRTLSAAEIGQVMQQQSGGELDRDLLARWTHASQQDGNLVSLPPGTLVAQQLEKGSMLINEPADGFRGIWYFNQPSGDEYVYKYSGGLGTYCAKHIPLAWYAPDVNRTFFVYGGTDRNNSTLYHMISYYDHATGLVSRPTTLLDKKTTDAHDNPVLNIDDDGYLWIFSSSHGKARPSYISRSTKPYDISEFELMWTGNYSYPQPSYHPGRGFFFMHTWYQGGRSLYCMTSPDGQNWSPRKLLSRIDQGHYQVSFPKDGAVGTSFNMHPDPQGLNWRTNLYYMESDDMGSTWKAVDGTVLSLPLTEADNPALVKNYRELDLNVYMKDLNYDSAGRPIILFVTSKGYESGPENMPRTWTTARWDGNTWQVHGQIVSDNNYDTGCLHIESDNQWRLIGPTETGPQPYNPGGEMAMWLTQDAGQSWTKVKQLTHDSPYNHTYARRPVNAHPDFYALWADGHGRQPSESRLYFCNRDGDVFRLPQKIPEGQDVVQAEAVFTE